MERPPERLADSLPRVLHAELLDVLNFHPGEVVLEVVEVGGRLAVFFKLLDVLDVSEVAEVVADCAAEPFEERLVVHFGVPADKFHRPVVEFPFRDDPHTEAARHIVGIRTDLQVLHGEWHADANAAHRNNCPARPEGGGNLPLAVNLVDRIAGAGTVQRHERAMPQVGRAVRSCLRNMPDDGELLLFLHLHARSRFQIPRRMSFAFSQASIRSRVSPLHDGTASLRASSKSATS